MSIRDWDWMDNKWDAETQKDRFLKLVSPEKTNTIKRNKRRIRNRWWKRPLRKLQLKWLLFKDKVK